MLKFYYSKGSSAVAAHILLEEVGVPYAAIEVSIPDAAHKAPAFLAKSPKGRIPVLETSHGTITENPAILEYIAATYPDAHCLPQGNFAQTQARSLCAYLCATAHVAFAHLHRGSRWAQSEGALADMQAQVPKNLISCAKFLENDLAFAPWALGGAYTYCDPYLLQFTRWLDGANVAIDQFPKLSAHRQAMRDRPATAAVLNLHASA